MTRLRRHIAAFGGWYGQARAAKSVNAALQAVDYARPKSHIAA